MLKYLIIMSCILLSFDASALTHKEYMQLKLQVYANSENYQTINKKAHIKELQETYFKARYKLISQAAKKSPELAALFEKVKVLAPQGDSKELFMLKSKVELHLISKSQQHPSLSELYKKWHRARTDLENKRASLISNLDKEAGNKYRQSVKKIQSLRRPNEDADY